MVYEDVAKPIAERSIDGYNGTIFAYGQTGSGKTHTMMGDDKGEEVGIIPRLNRHIFGMIDEATNDETKFLVSVSYLEIYNEV